MRWLVGILALLLLAAAGCGQAARAVAFESMIRGAYSGVRERTVLLLTDQEAWAAHWGRHSAIFHPRPEPPPVDFDRSAVVAVHLGERPTGGYGVTVTAVEQEPGRLRVRVLRAAPEPGAPVTMALTQPYHFVRIPAVEPGTAVQVDWGR